MKNRLTTNKHVSEMGMYELAHNCCYAKNREAFYQDFEIKMPAREYAKDLLVSHGVWNSEVYEKELIDDDYFDEEILESLSEDARTSITGLIALFYRNLWAMADLRETLKEYEDLEEQGLLLRLPCKVGDTVYYISEGFIEPCTVEVIFLSDYMDKDGNYSYMAEIHYDREDCPYVSTEIYLTDIGKTVFLTREEAEKALEKMKGGADETVL